MKTAKLNTLYLTRGDTFYYSFTFKSNNQPIDLSLNNAIEVDVRSGISRRGKLIKKLILNDGLEITADDNNTLVMTINPEVTENMRAGKYYIDIRITDANNNKFTYAWGIIQVRENITD